MEAFSSGDDADGALVGPIAVRPFTVALRQREKRTTHAAVRLPPWPSHVLTFDTETTTDAAQALLFGCYRLSEWRGDALACGEEGLFYADELPSERADEFRVLRDYAATHHLRLRSREEFVKRVLYPCMCELGAIIAGFNLPFDLSRIAVECGEARGRFYGGFSFVLADYADAKGRRKPDNYYARICVKSLDSKRALIGLSGGRESRKGMHGRARFLDLRTLTFALTNTSHSLASACDAFGTQYRKTMAEEHGRVTADYIAYNRTDVRASEALLIMLRTEFDRHPIALDPCQAYSPASVAKAYLRAFGLTPPAQQFDAFPRRALGDAMCAYYGGRSEVRIRNAVVPTVYTDFLSMYPTVNALLGLWRLLTAERLDAVDATEEVKQVLHSLTVDNCFDKTRWSAFAFFAQVQPCGDVLPVRAQYADDVRGWNIGVNPLCADEPIWYAGPDLIASTLLSGRAPDIIRAFRLVPHRAQSELTPVDLAGRLRVDPRDSDFFRRLPEERARAKARRESPKDAIRRDREFLKVLANSGSYGIFAQVNSEELPTDRRARLTVHGNSTTFACESPFTETPGPFCFPPFAALIPAAARLMLALLERCVTDAGGQYVLCDTDSMAIVASESGGVVQCPGGPLLTADGKPGVRALSWRQVDDIVARFASLSPYDSAIIPGSILKVEDENVGADGAQRQLYVLAISAKRYALFERREGGAITIRKYSEHGLGHLLSPISAEDGETDWIKQVWQDLISAHLGSRKPRRTWRNRPAIARISVSSPHVLRPLADKTKSYRQRIKPFNFALSANVDAFGHPPDANPQHFHLVAPYERDARKWLDLDWTDVHSGNQYAVTTSGPATVGAVAVKSYRDVVAAYATHPEPKSAAPDGGPCDRTTRGLLARRSVFATHFEYIGKESRRIEEVDAGQVHSLDAVVTRFADAEVEWRQVLRPFLVSLTRAEGAQKLGLSERAVSSLRAGKSSPGQETRVQLRNLWLQYTRTNVSRAC